MKQWKNEKMVICGSNRWQEIKYATNRDCPEQGVFPYVRYRNQRIWLDEFTTSPHGFKEESELCGMEIHAVACSSMFTANLIHIDSSGDKAMVFYSYCK